MNILFFLTPKSQVAYVTEDFSIRQTAEKLLYHHYTAIPILSKDGKYIGTVSDGDLFWHIKAHAGMDYKVAEDTSIMEVKRAREVEAIRYDSNMDDMIRLAVNQNFVPVLDDHHVFMGLVTRKRIIEYFIQNQQNSHNPNA